MSIYFNWKKYQYITWLFWVIYLSFCGYSILDDQIDTSHSLKSLPLSLGFTFTREARSLTLTMRRHITMATPARQTLTSVTTTTRTSTMSTGISTLILATYVVSANNKDLVIFSPSYQFFWATHEISFAISKSIEVFEESRTSVKWILVVSIKF